MRWLLGGLVAAALVVPVTGVGSGSQKLPQKIGKPEGSLVLLQWPGYSHPSFAGDYERETGCKITRRDVKSSDDFVDLMQRGPYDLVSASGDVSGELIARHYVRPVNVKLIPGWRQLSPAFRSPVFNTVRNVHYGVTNLWTPNELLSRSDKAKPPPVSWRAVYDSRFRRKISVPDNPMQIADAALYLKTREPSLRIRDPYELTPRQFDAAVALLRRQRPLVARYWQFASEQILDFRTATAIVGSSWPYQHQVLMAADVPVRRRVPREGATAWADSWLLAKQARHPNCAYLWMRHVLRPDVQAAQSLLLRESPANPLACPIMDSIEEGSCAAYYGSAPSALLQRLSFWHSPRARCGFGGRMDCVPYKRWQQAWANVVG